MERTAEHATAQTPGTWSTCPSDLLAGNSPSSAFLTANAARRFEIGAEVFLADTSTINKSLAESATIGLGFDTITSLIHPEQPSRFTPSNVNAKDAQGVFLVLRRFIKVRGVGLAVVGATTNNDVANSHVHGPLIYHIRPQNGVGRDMLVAATNLVRVRFRRGDWVWFLTESTGETRKEKAMVIAADVLKGRTVYHVHVVDQHCDRLLVPDEQLENIAANVA